MLRSTMVVLFFLALGSPALAADPLRAFINLCTGQKGRVPAGSKSTQIKNLEADVARYIRRHPEALYVPLERGEIKVSRRAARRFEVTADFVVDGEVTPKAKGPLVYPVVEMGREEGLRALWQKTRTSKFEHAWAFVPKLNVWIDITLANQNHSYSRDLQLVSALQSATDAVEFYHSHPEPVLRAVYAARPDIPYSPTVAGALPTTADLDVLIRKAWDNRGVRLAEGIIHPNGVTLFVPTRTLLLSGIGPGLTDVGTGLGIPPAPALSIEQQINQLISAQIDRNQIAIAPGDQRAFKIEYFPIEFVEGIQGWLKYNLTRLVGQELADQQR